MSYQTILEQWDEDQRSRPAIYCSGGWRKLNRSEKWRHAHTVLAKRVEKQRVGHQVDDALTHCRVVMESFWEYEQRPYYKISPAAIDHLIRTDLEEVPSDAFVLPSPRVAMLEFEKHPRFIDTEGMWLQYALVGMWSPDRPLSTMRPHGWGIAEPRTALDPAISHLYCRVQVGCEDKSKRQTSRFWSPLRPGETMRDAVWGGAFGLTSKSPPQMNFDGELRSWLDLYVRFTHLLATLGFLAAADDPIIRPDVLERYRDEYYDRATCQHRKDDILEKTRRKGRRGWLVGYDYGLTPATAGDSEGSGWSAASIRRGHLRTRKIGDEVVTKFVPPFSVRPDLPFSKETDVSVVKTRPSTLTVTLNNRDKSWSAQSHKCHEDSRKILEKSVLPEFASAGEFILKPRTQITQRSNRLWKPLRCSHQTIGLRVKPDNNNSCWEYELIVPNSVDAAYVFEQMKRRYEKTKSTLDIEEDAVVEKPAEPVVRSFKDLPNEFVAALPDPRPSKLASKHPLGPYDKGDPVGEYAAALALSAEPASKPAPPAADPAPTAATVPTVSADSLLSKLQGIEGLVKAAQDAQGRKETRKKRLDALAQKRADLAKEIAQIEEDELKILAEEENDVPAKEAEETLAALNRVLSMFQK